MTSMITSGKVRMRQILTYLCLCADWLCTQNMWLKCWPTCACVLIMYIQNVWLKCWHLYVCLCVLIMYTQSTWLKCWPACACVCWLCTPKVYDWNVDQLVPVYVDYAHPKYMTEMLTSLCLCVLIVYTQNMWLKCWPACACVYTVWWCSWKVSLRCWPACACVFVLSKGETEMLTYFCLMCYCVICIDRMMRLKCWPACV